jgi:hypothetical protein
MDADKVLGTKQANTTKSNAATKALQAAQDKATAADKALAAQGAATKAGRANAAQIDKANAIKNADAFPVTKSNSGSSGKTNSTKGSGGGGTGASSNDDYEYSSGSYGSSGSSGGSRKTSGGTSTTTPQTTLNSLVDSLYGAQDTAYQGMADSANASLKSAYDYNLQKQGAERDDALREAYIQGEMSKRNIAEQLSRQGIVGGAAESTLARLISNYQGARNEARGDYASGVQEMGNNYMTNANENTNYYKQQAQGRKNTIYDTLLNYMLSNYGKTTQTGSTKSYTYDENGNVTGITETPQYSIDTDTAKKLAAIIGSLSA